MKLLAARAFGALTFLTLLCAQVAALHAFVPRPTDKQMHDFLLISMGLAFTPVLLVAALALAACAAMVLIAYYPGRAVFELVRPPAEPARPRRPGRLLR